MRKRIIILGSTGSIGRAAIDVATALADRVEIVGLTAHSRWRELAIQARETGARAIGLGDEALADGLRAEIDAARVYAGEAALVDLVRETEADFVLSAIVGAAGLAPTLAAVERGLDVGIANKESLVIAGSLLMPLARQRGCRLIPVDSEHSAIFQCLQAGQPEEVRRLCLTASGGPFREWSVDRIRDATLADALRHPTWDMGPKITIDSATMMNKALEVIEASLLFDMPPDRIDVLIHPESIIHSMVEFVDGSVIAQLGAPDMRTPIQYALTFPARLPKDGGAPDWSRIRRLSLEPPDPGRFPALRLGYEAARLGGSSGAALNAANEAAVERFRAGAIRFGQIVELTQSVFEEHRNIPQPTLEDLLRTDAWAREEVAACLTHS